MVQATSSSTTPPASDASTANQGINRLAQKDIFLQLLVAQIRNQNPLNPADGTQFLAQLAQFSQLEQSVQMRQELEAIHADLTSAAASETTMETQS